MQPENYHIAIGHVEWRVFIGIGASAIAALALHFIIFAVIRRIIRRTQSTSDDIMIRAVYQPSRWLILILILTAGMQAVRLGPQIESWWTIGSTMVLVGITGWLALRVVGAFKKIVEASVDITAEDNLQARRRTTRVRILNRIVQVTILFLTLAFMLLAIPSVRAIGVTLMASAGLAALAVGAAAQPALKNLIAGIQMAFTEPIRLDDVVIVEGEWGKIEDIRLTYVVVCIWDERRLVVPVSYFLEKPFQNWTRETSHLLGTVFFHVDPTTDVDRIRAKLTELVQDNPRWDRRVVHLQVTEVRPEAMELRALVTAKDAPTAYDLRCDVREAMMAFLRDEMPECLPRHRLLTAQDERPPFIDARDVPDLQSPATKGIPASVVSGDGG